MRVTGDCFLVPDRFAAGFRVAFERAVTFVALLRLGPRADFAALFARLLDVGFDAVVVFERAFLPDDDFDAVAMMVPRGRYESTLRKIRARQIRPGDSLSGLPRTRADRRVGVG